MPGGRNGSVICSLYKVTGFRTWSLPSCNQLVQLRCRKVRDRAALFNSSSACEDVTDDGGRLMECEEYPVSKNKNLIQVNTYTRSSNLAFDFLLMFIVL